MNALCFADPSLPMLPAVFKFILMCLILDREHLRDFLYELKSKAIDHSLSNTILQTRENVHGDLIGECLDRSEIHAEALYFKVVYQRMSFLF